MRALHDRAAQCAEEQRQVARVLRGQPDRLALRMVIASASELRVANGCRWCLHIVCDDLF